MCEVTAVLDRIYRAMFRLEVYSGPLLPSSLMGQGINPEDTKTYAGGGGITKDGVVYSHIFHGEGQSKISSIS